MYSASKYIPGLGKLFYISPEHVSTEGGAEKYIPGLGLQVSVPAECISEEGGAEKYIPGLGNQFYLNPDHIEMDALSVTLSQAEPVESAVVITATVTGGVATKITKYLSGTAVVDDFASAGTDFTDTFSVDANGDYTVYAKDAIGNETVSTITVSTLA